MKKIVVLGLTLILFFVSPKSYADSYTENINDIPDFTQTNKALPNNGNTLCAPVSVSNSLMWLSKNGFPKLTDNKEQIEIVKELTVLMNAAENGANSKKIINGLTTYIESKGYKIKKLEYQGRRNKQHKIPDIKSLLKALKKGDSAWLNLGWYRYKIENNEDIYERDGGHWVTLVGYENNPTTNEPETLIIHDPSPRDGKTFNNGYIKLVPLRNGTLRPYKDKKYSGLPTEARGYYRLGGDIKVKKNRDFGIIDGIIILEM